MEEKQLLIKDFCSRLPYGLKLNFYSRATNENVLCTLLGVEPNGDKPIIAKTDNGAFTFTQDHVKPYLRPMSSMSEDEKIELKEYLGAEEVGCDGFGYIEGGTLEDYISRTPYSLCNYVIDWLNSHHFDYRGLVEKGLALEAPEGMYNTKTE